MTLCIQLHPLPARIVQVLSHILAWCTRHAEFGPVLWWDLISWYFEVWVYNVQCPQSSVRMTPSNLRPCTTSWLKNKYSYLYNIGWNHYACNPGSLNLCLCRTKCKSLHVIPPTSSSLCWAIVALTDISWRKCQLGHYYRFFFINRKGSIDHEPSK